METLRYKPTRADHERHEKFCAMLDQSDSEYDDDDDDNTNNESTMNTNQKNTLCSTHSSFLSPPSSLSTATTVCGTPLSSLAEMTPTIATKLHTQLPLYKQYIGVAPKLWSSSTTVDIDPECKEIVVQWSSRALNFLSAHMLARRILHERQWRYGTVYNCYGCGAHSDRIICDAQMNVLCEACVEKYAMCLMCMRTQNANGTMKMRQYRLSHNAICDACSYRAINEQHNIACEIILLCGQEQTAT